MERTLTVILTLENNECFTVNVMDNESGLSTSFNQDTPDICEKIGVEIMSWVDMMDYEEE